MITGLSIPMRNKAITQYLGMPVTSIAVLNGKTIVTTSDGIHVLDNNQSDNAKNIDACVKTLRTDFGHHAQKRIRTVYVRGLMKHLKATLSTETKDLSILHEPRKGFSQTGCSFQGQRDQVGTYWQFEFKNILGEDFSIDGIDIALNVLSLRR